MRTIPTYTTMLLEELTAALNGISEEQAETFMELLLGARRIYTAGAGRSGFMTRAFAMRLMHLGLPVYVVGEAVTPALGAGDLLVIGSGSGETGSLAAMAEKAKQSGASVALVTVEPSSRIGRLADAVVRIPGATKALSEHEARSVSVQPMGSLFEQALLLFFDSLVLRLMEKLDLTAESMKLRHANLE
jgi:6-phospho-3-hexuloisomerase